MSNIGKKRQKITIERPVTTQDEFGEEIEGTPTTVATRWAEVRPLNGRELVVAQQVNAQLSHEVKLRYDSALNLTSADRFIFDSRTLNIESVINVGERNKEFVVMCKEQK